MSRQTRSHPSSTVDHRPCQSSLYQRLDFSSQHGAKISSLKLTLFLALFAGSTFQKLRKPYKRNTEAILVRLFTTLLEYCQEKELGVEQLSQVQRVSKRAFDKESLCTSGETDFDPSCMEISLSFQICSKDWIHWKCALQLKQWTFMLITKSTQYCPCPNQPSQVVQPSPSRRRSYL